MKGEIVMKNYKTDIATLIARIEGRGKKER